MKYLIVHCNSENSWLSSAIQPYDNIDGYTVKREAVDGLALSETEIITDFQQVVAHFLSLANGSWTMKQIKCFQDGSYNVYEDQEYSEEMEMMDGEMQTVTGTRPVLIDTIPVIQLRLTDESTSINDSQRFNFVKSTDLPTSIETAIVSIWKYFFAN